MELELEATVELSLLYKGFTNGEIKTLQAHGSNSTVKVS